jgi:hypothetical protein
MKLERSNISDLLESMAAVPATHAVHVEVNREDEGRFYNTAKGIKTLQRVVVTADGLEAQNDSRTPMKALILNEVKERKTKRAREQRSDQHADVEHLAQLDECQVCFGQEKSGELPSIWIQCEECDRSWHKECVGYEADAALDDVQWQKCGQCGGSDPKATLGGGRTLMPAEREAGDEDPRVNRGWNDGSLNGAPTENDGYSHDAGISIEVYHIQASAAILNPTGTRLIQDSDAGTTLARSTTVSLKFYLSSQISWRSRLQVAVIQGSSSRTN